MFSTRKREDATKIIEPVADPEPPKIGPDGFLTAAWGQWEWRQAERQLQARTALGRIGYTPSQTAAVTAATRDRDSDLTVVARLQEQRAEMVQELGRRRARLEDARRMGHYVPDQSAEVVAMIAETDKRLARALGELARTTKALAQVTDAADADVARRRAALQVAS